MSASEPPDNGGPGTFRGRGPVWLGAGEPDVEACANCVVPPAVCARRVGLAVGVDASPPAVAPDGKVYVTTDHGVAEIGAVGAPGWQVSLPLLGPLVATEAWVIGLAILPPSDRPDDGPALQVVALARATGTIAWQRVIAASAPRLPPRLQLHGARLTVWLEPQPVWLDLAAGSPR